MILETLLTLCDPVIILTIFAGVSAGLFVGAMPGLTATMALAVLLPVAWWRGVRLGRRALADGALVGLFVFAGFVMQTLGLRTLPSKTQPHGERKRSWYVYQAIFDTSDHIRDRIKRYHDHGIGVEGTILLGLDHHTEDYIKGLIDFLLEIELDMAEFTVLTPFPHTKAFDELKAQDRIFSYDWNDYSADKVVYHPKQMSAEKLQQLFYDAWDTFYADESQEMKMFKLFQRVIEKEMADNTFKPRNRDLASRAFGKKA